jgi:hypothetical protein
MSVSNSFLQELTHVQFASSSPFRARRIARRLSGAMAPKVFDVEDHIVRFEAGSLGCECFSYLVGANASWSGWSSWCLGRVVYFQWSLEAEAASDGGW